MEAAVERVVALAPKLGEAMSADDLLELGNSLHAIGAPRPAADDTVSLAGKLLSDGGTFAPAMLRCAAFGARWLANPGECSDAVSHGRQAFGLASVAAAALCASALSSAKDLPVVGVTFLRTLLRMDTLRCCSRFLAARYTRLLQPEPAAVTPTADESGTSAGPAGEGAGDGDDAAPDPPRPTQEPDLIACQDAAIVCGSLLLHLSMLASGASEKPEGEQAAPQPQPQRGAQAPAAAASAAAAAAAEKERRRLEVMKRVYVGELVSALADSAVVEHLCRAVLVAAMVQAGPMGPAGPAGAVAARANTPLKDPLSNLISLQGVLRALADLWEEAPQNGGGAAATAKLRAAMSGPCAQHLSLSVGLAALCLADGGCAHGLPPPLLALPVMGVDRERGTAVDIRAAHGRQTVFQLVPSGLVSSLTGSPPAVPPCDPRFAAPLLLRVAAWAVASGRAWAEPDPEPEPKPEAEHGNDEPGEGDGGADGDGAQPLPPPPLPPLQVVLAKKDLAGLAARALLSVDAVSGKQARAGEAWAQRAAARRWRWTVEACFHVAPVADADGRGLLADAFCVVDGGQLFGHGGRIAPEPPPHLTAALRGGLLTGLARLIRRAAARLDGPEAAFAAELLGPKRSGHILLARLLAYGPIQDAAALVTSFAKLLRRGEAEVAADPSSAASGHVHEICSTPYNFFIDITADLMPSLAPVDRQLRTMAVRAAAEWLPSLSRMGRALARHVLEGRFASHTDVVAWLPHLVAYTQPVLCWLRLLPPMPRPKNGEPAGSRSGAGGGASTSSPMPSPPQARMDTAGGSSSDNSSGGGRAAGSAGAGPSDAATATGTVAALPPGGVAAAEFRAAWKQYLVDEACSLPLLGAVMRLALGWTPGPRPRQGAGDFWVPCNAFMSSVVMMAAMLAGEATEDVRRAAQPAGAGSAGAGAAVAGAAGGAADAGAGAWDEAEPEAFRWSPELFHHLARQLRSLKLPQAAEPAEALAVLVSGWAGRKGGGAGSARGARELATVAKMGEGVWSLEAELTALSLPTLAEARAVVPVCGNPGCSRLEEDGEAGPELGVVGAGGVMFCCEECAGAGGAPAAQR